MVQFALVRVFVAILSAVVGYFMAQTIADVKFDVLDPPTSPTRQMSPHAATTHTNEKSALVFQVQATGVTAKELIVNVGN